VITFERKLMPVPTRCTSKIQTWHKKPYAISTDPAKIDVEVVHAFLTRSYWARGIPRNTVALSLENCLPFGMYYSGKQVGGARVITDCATFAYLDDVFILQEHRGKGLGRWLLKCIMGHPDLQGLRYWHLRTDNAHGLYRGFGFVPIGCPEWSMEITLVNPYRNRKL
jgi:GNAT superfamily N-acetyltransferase